VPSNEQRRQAAKRKLERQLARRAERAKKRRVWGVGLTVLVVVGVVGLVFWLTNLGPDDSSAATKPSDDKAEKKTDGPCAYKENAAEKPPKDVGMPEDPAETPKKGTVNVDLDTSQGAIGLTLDRAKAPCTVQSMEHLVKEKFFDGTKCHRMFEGVLQCGDPSAKGKGYRETDGTGGPAYRFGSENLPTDQRPAYPAGVVAMANSGSADSNGSQFFIVYKDVQLDPSYTILGRVTKGLDVVEKATKAGDDGAYANSAGGGHPKNDVNLQSVTVS
jgi:peptidyl-prolyl cis-trans isomerase B (cyclophilin B)